MSMEFRRAEFAPENREALDRNLTQVETREFLAERGIGSLTDWQPGQPMLFVLDEMHVSDEGPYAASPPRMRPNIARLDAPTSLTLQTDTIADPPYEIENAGAQIDYYAIDAVTKQVTLVKTSHTVTKPNLPYFAKQGSLFMPADDIFPRSGS